MKVVLFGASGHVGFPVALALVRNGHIVVGVSRNPKTSKLFRTNEIIPAVGDIFEPSTWKEHLVDADVVIDCAAGDIHSSSLKLLHAISSTAESVRPAGIPKVAYIYTSGTWVHGDNRSTLRSDGSPLPNASPITAWRPGVEQEIIGNKGVRGIVIRPSVCYGRAGSLTAFLFNQGKSSEITWFGTQGGGMALIHVDDLAECYLLAVEKNHIANGLIFDCSQDHSESIDGILHAFAAHVGIPSDKIKYRAPENGLEEALAATSKLRPTLARSLLGWAPRKASLTDGIATYYEAFQAAQE
jgi:nucleoside-diphosphate-sugar epimerase